MEYTREDSCTLHTRWRTAVQYAWSAGSGSNLRQRCVRKDHLEMLKAAPLAAAPRKQQQRRSRPCNDSSNPCVIQASVGANKKKGLLPYVEQEITPQHAHFTDRNGRDGGEKGQSLLRADC